MSSRSPGSRSRGRNRARVAALQLGLVAVMVGSWVYSSGRGGVSPLVVPSISDTLVALVELVSEPALWVATRTTVLEIVVAFALSVITGFGVGFLGSRSDFRVKTYEPLLAWGYFIPFILFYPVFLLWLGVDEGSKIAYAALNGFFAVAFNTMKGFSAVDTNLVRAARAFGASRRQVEWSVKFPAALPVVVTGVRLGLALNVISVILAEMLGSRRGLGFELARASQTLQVPRTYALIAFIVAIVGIFHILIQRAEVRY